MIKIIEIKPKIIPQPEKFRYECECGCVFEYEDTDITVTQGFYDSGAIRCPNCNIYIEHKKSYEVVTR